MMTLLLSLVGLVVLLYLIGAGFFAWWASREERRQEDERARFEQILRASTPKDWPTRPGPKGFNGRHGRTA